MEKVIKIGLLALIIVLGYFLYDSIAGPIRQARLEEKIYNARVDRLNDIRIAQKAYMDVTDSFAENWDQLINVMKTGKYRLIKQVGDPEDTNSVVTFDTTYKSVLDSLYGGNAGVLDSLPWVPYSEIWEGDTTRTDEYGDKIKVDKKPGERNKFILRAGFSTSNTIKIPVFEVVEPEPTIKEKPLKVGKMSETTYKGSWE